MIWPFGRRKGGERDPRWAGLSARAFVCASCGQTHQGVLDLVADAPDAWTDGLEKRQGNAAATPGGHYLTDDFCVVGDESHFVRCVMEFPLIGTHQRFGYGLWSSLSPENFEIYLASFDDPLPPKPGPWFGWLGNKVKGYPDADALRCNVWPQPNRRPLLELHVTDQEDHPIVREQRGGLAFERLMALYALNGHDWGPSPAIQNS